MIRAAIVAMVLVGTLADARAGEALQVSVRVAGADGAPLAGAAVLVRGGGAAVEPSPAGEGVIEQRDATFVPETSIVPVGTSIRFPNFDRTRHHIYSFSAAKVFEVELYTGTPAEPVVFDQPGIVALGCNIHDWMYAVVYVVDTPLYGLTDSAGEAFVAVPERGDYSVEIWHPRVRGPGASAIVAVTSEPAHVHLVPELRAPDVRPKRPSLPPPPPGFTSGG